MLLPLRWLKDYVKIDATPEQIAEILANVGFPVEDTKQVDGDVVLDVEITSNRGDCQSVVGLAREIAAQSGAEFSLPTIVLNKIENESSERAESLTRLDVQDTARCPRYIARLIRGVTVGPSPAWLKKRLATLGLAPRNNIVDVTNYVLFELGHPLHAFDHDKLAEGRIVVRRARDGNGNGDGESFTPLYGDTPVLTPEDLVIADAEKPVALAGVVGGAGSEVGGSTTNILLEAAVFDPVGVRRTSRRTGIATDSSFRFERGVDPVRVDFASRRAAALIAEVAGGSVCAGAVDSNPGPDPDPNAAPAVSLRRERVLKILGYSIPDGEITRILAALGFALENQRDGLLPDGFWKVRVPSWRLRDVTREIDLIEEVARIHGYEHCPARTGMMARVPERNPREDIKRTVRGVLTAGGYDEVITDSLVPRGSERRFNPWQATAPLDLGQTAMRSDHAALRVSLLPGLLEVKLRNQNEAGREGIRVFQSGVVYLPRGETELPDERLVLGLLDDGDYAADGTCAVPGYRRIKGAIEAVMQKLNLPPVRLRAPTAPRDEDDPRFRGFSPGSCLDIVVADRTIGVAGDLGQAELLAELQTVPALAELDLAALLTFEAKPPVFAPLPRFPAVARDVALVMDEAVTWANIIDAIDIDNARPELLEDVALIDIYRGKQIETGKKSLAFRLVYRAPERTLTDDEVAGFHEPLVEHLCAVLDATQRGG